MGSLQGIDQNTSEFMITMPAIRCSFPLRIHPHAPHLMQVGNAWLVDCSKRVAAACESIQLAMNLFSVDHNVNSGYGLLVTLFFANAISMQRVLPVLKLMNWFFMLDTCVDEPGMFGADPAKSMHIIDSVLALFKPTPDKVADPLVKPALHENIACDNGSSSILQAANITQELAHILTSMAAEWWSDMCADMPSSQQARFCETLRGYLGCILKETPFRSACTLPDVQTYLRIRSQSIAWYPLCLLTEYTLCMELKQDAVTNPLLIALKESVCEATIIINDITSFRKEYEGGDHFNIIMVLCWQKLQCRAGGDAAAALPRTWAVERVTPELLQESMNEACEMVKERDQQCVCMIEKIKGSPELMEKAGMGAFLEAMGNYFAGNIYWHLTSERFWLQPAHYNGKSPDQIVTNGMADVLGCRTLLLKKPHLTPF